MQADARGEKYQKKKPPANKQEYYQRRSDYDGTIERVLQACNALRIPFRVAMAGMMIAWLDGHAENLKAIHRAVPKEAA